MKIVMKEKIVNFIKNIAREILYDELEEYENRVNLLQDSNAKLAAESLEWSKTYYSLSKVYDALRSEVKNSCKIILPAKFFNKLIEKLPDPNLIGNMVKEKNETKRLDASFHFGRISCRYICIRKTSETNVVMKIEISDAVRGTEILHLPVTLVNLSSNDNCELTTWVWNVWKSGLCVVNDELYDIIYTATEAWTNVKRELL